jgi:CHAT domain-containing protein
MDLYGLDLQGALVTLSACETGRQRMLGGDLFGLSRAFFCGGASALVASLWPVSDISTAHMMEGFYTYMTRGETAAAALRKAQLDLYRMQTLENGHSVKPYAHPFYWAPFYLSGASEVRLQERRL